MISARRTHAIRTGRHLRDLLHAPRRRNLFFAEIWLERLLLDVLRRNSAKRLQHHGKSSLRDQRRLVVAQNVTK